jgi:Myb DNA-binding like
MMTRYFPHRTRHQIKLKFKLEEKRNPTLVDKALTNSNHYDISELETEFSKYPPGCVLAGDYNLSIF